MSALPMRIAAVLAILGILTAPHFVSAFDVTLLNFIGIYALVAIGLTLLTGVGGLVSFGQAAFVGIGAYSTAWLTTVEGQSPWLGLAFAILLTCAVAAVLGAVTLRLKGHFLSLSTLAWGLAIGFCFGNIDGLGHFTGIADIPPIRVGSLALIGSGQIYYLIWAFVIAAVCLTHNLLDSRAGRAMRALRGGNLLVESLGVDAFRVRLTLFVIAAFLSALSGWLYAHLSRYVSPSPFDVGMGIEYLMMAMVGGAASPIGGVVGAALISILKNSIQDYLPLLAKGLSGQLEIVVFSVLFIIFLQRARDGVTPFIAKRLPKAKPISPAPAPPLAQRSQPTPGAPLLQVRNAERRFKGLIAVNQLSFDVAAGEIVALIGPNGAGKSTMFNLLTGALRLTSGSIIFNGREVRSISQCRIARAGVARTFQHVKLRPQMTVLDNVLLGAYGRLSSGVLAGALRLNRAEEARVRYEALRQLERVGLAERAFDLAGNLPLGEQRLLEIARALIADPILLVLDEPAAGLRRQEKQALAELMRSLRAERLTILLVEHDMDFVMNLADRVVVMEFGAKLSEGAPAQVRDDPRVQEAYLGGVA
ncbi:ATP-binding cassette domain-containing protein [Methylocapsa sp. S129]|uniref:branched-chain amino acid ABC transporter ATP-binding protein/permease n=1 Tax=Methylocapsa sp. S129 TaxID=1641869 RepID=UPI00131DA3CD|nr:branched-chain amino acid ABC transporter ATP-binding protein/permease [Methylocapsa sp. S129]